MRKINNLKGMVFGRLIVVEHSGFNKSGNTTWKCMCDCGKETIVMGSSLTTGRTRSCGCYKIEKTSERHFVDLSGKKFGKLNVLEIVGKKRGRYFWKCVYDCGKETIVETTSLSSGHTSSCGCYQKERTSKTRTKDLIGQKFGKLLVIEKKENHKQPSGQIKTIWLCKCDCGKETSVRSSSLLSGNTLSCGCLNHESFISHELKKYFTENYNAETEYRILKNPNTGYWLPYDIYIPNGKNPLTNGVYIEINGNQHYILNKWHKRQSNIKNTTPKEEFAYQKEKDRLKRQFAKNNGVYIEIDLRNIKTVEEAIRYIKGK